MKSTSKVLSVLLVVTMLLGVLAGCSSKQPEPAELFVNAINMYRDALNDDPTVALLKQSSSKASWNVLMEQGTGDEKVKMDLTAYLDESGKAGSLDAKVDAAGQKVDLQMLLSDKKVVLGTSLLKDAYGIDLTKAKENFPTSLFGTKGGNLLDMSEEDEKRFLDAFDEMATTFQKEHKTVDVYQIFMDAFTAKATFTADTKTPATVAGQEVKKNTTVTATVTKAQLKSILNEMIAKAEMQETVDQFLKAVNETIKSEAEWNDEEPVTLENMNAFVDYAFDQMEDVKFEDDDVIATIKLVLDAKHNAIMLAALTFGEDTITIDCGTDPRNIKHIAITYPVEELVLDNAIPTKKNVTITIDIEKGATSTTYTFLNEELDGFQIVDNKAQKKVSLYELVEGKPNGDAELEFTYNITANSLMVKFADEDMSVTITLTTNVESPVKYDNFKDLLTMSQAEFDALLEELEPLLGPVYPDEPEYDSDIEGEFDDAFDAEF